MTIIPGEVGLKSVYVFGKYVLVYSINRCLKLEKSRFKYLISWLIVFNYWLTVAVNISTSLVFAMENSNVKVTLLKSELPVRVIFSTTTVGNIVDISSDKSSLSESKLFELICSNINNRSPKPNVGLFIRSPGLVNNQLSKLYF
jgi:hypothetical protein